MPAIRRTIKKTTYAILFGLILSIPVALLAAPGIAVLRRAPVDVPPVVPVSVVVESVDSVVSAESVDFVARIRNPNPRAGVPDFPVTFILFGKDGQEVQRLQETTYLLPGSLTYVAALDVPLSADLTQVKLEVPHQPQFTSVSKTVALPTFNSFLRSRNLKTVGATTIEVQSGVVTNTSTLGFRRVDITGVAFDRDGRVVGIGKTFIGQFGVGEQREFTIQWPVPTAATERVIILPSTNIYREENILPVKGDPSLLR